MGEQLSKELQKEFISTLNSSGTRQAKVASGIYLMEKVNYPAVLIECGFLSNPEEEAKLRDPAYQKKLCSVIACVVGRYLNT